MVNAVKLISNLVVFFAVTAIVSACEVDLSSDDVPGCMTYWYGSKLQCVTAFNSCTAVYSCRNVMWGKSRAICFDGCATTSYLNAFPVCLATEAEIGCNVVYNGEIPTCLTNHCNEQVTQCSRIGFCPNFSGVYCFDGCVSKGMNWNNSVPYCDDNTTPCIQGELHPECANQSSTSQPIAPSS